MEIFESKTDEGCRILALKGKLDALSSPSFREKVFSMIEGGELRILVDCSGLDYVSSAGLRVFFEAVFKIQGLSGKLCCYGVNSNVKKIFDLADLTSEMRLFPSREEAAKHC